MNQPDVTVVIPLYNAERFIAETLKALQAQTLANFQAIVIDDGSQDGGAEVVKAFRDKDRRISLVRQKNHGVSRTRNRGAGMATTAVIAFLDADDVWHPEFLARTVGYLNAKPGTSVCFARTRFVDEAGQPIGALSRPRTTGLALTDFLSGNPTTTCSNLVVRREDFLSSGGFQAGLNHAEDQLWLLKMYLSGKIIEGIDSVLLDYRANANGLSSDTGAMGRGWDEMADAAAKFDDKRVASAIPAARAINRLYLAQRAWRTRGDAGQAARHLYEALQSDWRATATDLAARFVTLARPHSA